jgi:Fe-Mn family superoxide dismutase
MAIELPALPYDRAALEPHISAETLDYHHGKHHKAYVDNLNRLTEGTAFDGMALEEIVRQAQGAMFDNAAQAWNHGFYWRCLKPNGGGAPDGELADRINAGFGDFARFKDEFGRLAVSNFGSGWTWLVQRADGSLGIVSSPNAVTPLTGSDTPLLVVDVWEHAYYIDYRNARAKYVESFWNLVDWDFVASNLV